MKTKVYFEVSEIFLNEISFLISFKIKLNANLSFEEFIDEFKEFYRKWSFNKEF